MNLSREAALRDIGAYGEEGLNGVECDGGDLRGDAAGGGLEWTGASAMEQYKMGREAFEYARLQQETYLDWTENESSHVGCPSVFPGESPSFDSPSPLRDSVPSFTAGAVTVSQVISVY